MTFNIQDWYYQVTDDVTEVWSTNRIQYVSITDDTYVAWSSDQTHYTVNVDTPQNLVTIILTSWLPTYLSMTGLPIVSTATPALNATYPLDVMSQNNVTGILASIATSSSVPGSGDTFNYLGVDFISADFVNLGKAMTDYVYNLYQAVSSLILTGAGTVPTTPVTIA